VWLTNSHEHAQSLSLLLSHLFVCGSLDQTTIHTHSVSLFLSPSVCVWVLFPTYIRSVSLYFSPSSSLLVTTSN